MTKTKKQLRAEAVERLRALKECKTTFYALDIMDVVLDVNGKAPRVAARRVDNFINALIDLLTDDMDMSISNLMCPNNDSREKLEADAVSVLWRVFDAGAKHDDSDGEPNIGAWMVRPLLDRQEAITERECLVQNVQGADAILTAWNVELQAKVDELEKDVSFYSGAICGALDAATAPDMEERILEMYNRCSKYDPHTKIEELEAENAVWSGKANAAEEMLLFLLEGGEPDWDGWLADHDGLCDYFRERFTATVPELREMRGKIDELDGVK